MSSPLVPSPEPPSDSGAESRIETRPETEADAYDAYDAYRRAEELLGHGSPEAAAIILQRLREQDPDSTSLLEAWARALFDTRRFEEAAQAFRDLADRSPDSDYAHFGLGMALWRLQRFPAARDHLAMAMVMRPERRDYAQAHGQVSATLRARSESGLPAEGPVHP